MKGIPGKSERKGTKAGPNNCLINAEALEKLSTGHTLSLLSRCSREVKELSGFRVSSICDAEFTPSEYAEGVQLHS